MTDAAGSITRSMARDFGITLLDSYVIVGDTSVPETLMPPLDVYAAMRAGTKVSRPRRPHLNAGKPTKSVLQRYGRVLYLSVGSVYYGQFRCSDGWKAQHDRDDRF